MTETTLDPGVEIHPPDPGTAAFMLFDDAIAITDRDRRRLLWVSARWLRALPGLPRGATIDAAVAAVPSLAPLFARHQAPADASGDGDPPTGFAPVVAETGRWVVEGVALADGRLAVRLTDRHAQAKALQRQLDDRERLLFTSRVLSVGEMATTLAHELNQPIAATAALLRGLKLRTSRREGGLQAEESAALERALDQVTFAARIIARIREFTHAHRPRPERVDLAELLRMSASLLDWDLQRAGVGFVLETASGPVEVMGDPVMLQQVVVNLVRNGIDALRTDPPARPRLLLRLLSDRERAEVQVSDNGCGLDDEAAQRLFVPFASSKPTGMGLGLSICRSFVEQHQGRLWFSRNRDRGTTFHLALPLVSTGDPA